MTLTQIKFSKIVIAIIFTFLGTTITNAQTSLSKGDIAFTGYFGNGTATNVNDQFSFVLLKNITTNTVINFTDNGWIRTSSTTGNFRTGEGTVTYTSNASYTAGTEILITLIANTATATATLVSAASAGSATGTVMPSLSANGDQVIAYQGVEAAPIFLSAIHMNVYAVATGIAGVPGGDPVTTTTAEWDGAHSGTSASGLPSLGGTNFLTNGTDALWIPGSLTAEKDDAVFSCTGSLNTADQVRAAVNDVANWTTSDNDPAPLVLPTGCSYIIALPAPTINSSPANSAICEGSGTTFMFTASNATTYQWQVRVGSDYVNISNNSMYSGALTTQLTINAALVTMNSYLYRGVAINGSGSTNSSPASLTVTPLPVNPSLLTKSPAALTVADGTPVKATFTAGSGGTTCTDDYRYTTDGGATYSPYTPNTDISTTGLAGGTGFVFIEGRRAACVSSCQNTYSVIASWAVTPLSSAATTLQAGDIAFTGYIGGNNTAADEFSFVLLRNIGPGTVINFTTTGWLSSGSFRTEEETVVWTSPSALPAGTEIKIAGLTATRSGEGDAGTITGVALTMSVNGDQVLAYRGSAGSPTFISGIHTNVFVAASGDLVTTTAAAWDGVANSINASALPPGLATGTNAIWIGVEGDNASEFDNAKFGNCSNNAVAGVIVTLRAALNNQSNWIRSDGGDPPSFALPTGCSYLARLCLIIVNNPAVTTATNGTNYSQIFTHSGGAGVVSFSTLSTLPNGLTLSSSGVLSGTPNAVPNTYSIVVTVTDANGCIGTGATYDLVLSGPITFYPKTSHSDLSLVSNWTTDVNGLTGDGPANFTSANQVFNVNRAGIVLNDLTISGGSNLIVTTTSGLEFGPLTHLSVGAGSNVNFDSNSVTLKSTSSGTASIRSIVGTLTNATNVTVERFITAASNRAFRLLGPSVNTTTSVKVNWQENQNNTDPSGYPSTGNNNTVPNYGTHITGSKTGANGFDATLTGESSLYNYIYGTPDTYQPAASTNAILDAKTGYLVYLRGDRTASHLTAAATSSNTILRATGSLLTGNISYPLQGLTKFSLVTNPYASAINWNSIYLESTALENYYTYLDPNVGSRGGYVTVTNAGVRNLNTAGINSTVDIQSGQAFFVKSAASGTPALTIKEEHKSPVNNIDVYRTVGTEQFSVALFYTEANGSRKVADGVNIIFNNIYTSVVDGDDAMKFTNFDENLAILRHGKLLAIESRPLVIKSDTIFFNITRLKEKVYEFEIHPNNFSSTNLEAVLKDGYTGKESLISLLQPTIVSFAVTSDPLSSAENRFEILFRQNAVLPVSISAEKAYQKGIGIQVDWNTLTESNVEKYEIEKSADGQAFTTAGFTLSKGNNGAMTNYDWFDANPVNGYNYYRIRTIYKNGSVEIGRVMRVMVGKGVEMITISPNPVEGNSITLQVSNFPKGRYSIIIRNTLGQKLYSHSFDHIGGSSTQSLLIGKILLTGIYQLEIIGKDKKIVQQLIRN